jgi:hypothetical protein
MRSAMSDHKLTDELGAWLTAWERYFSGDLDYSAIPPFPSPQGVRMLQPYRDLPDRPRTLTETRIERLEAGTTLLRGLSDSERRRRICWSVALAILVVSVAWRAAYGDGTLSARIDAMQRRSDMSWRAQCAEVER